MDFPQRPGQPLLQPARVLVQTLTHLLPSDGKIYKPERNPGGDKLYSMLHRICQHVWSHSYDSDFFRWYGYNDDQLGYNNRPCFFLVDHGEADNEADVPVLAFEWTGEEFKPMPGLLQSPDVQEELKATPFMTPPPSSEPAKPYPVRKMVRSMLRSVERVPDWHLQYITGHPEDMEWLKRKLRPRFYENLLAQIEARPREKEEDAKEASEPV
ncbi:uncharacterized protein APUU_40381A [Aspergillus puulaauensis]|uniref:Uncharacterized protein n=1 Tax=Aspergillus puulaauensis TaxID=1220207 RepID=A0A7R8AML5_9EURO|nr:uncharacterized protein APUU_40381A [Aspergillus puulaauensis]BCS23937.1 hypothetical protein APUU_40381A [Aspergillus puulaauensis]